MSAVHLFPHFWGAESVRIDHEIIDLTQKGGWRKLDSLGVWRRQLYYSTLQEFDKLTEGLKVAY
jgi:hypothetical protein